MKIEPFEAKWYEIRFYFICLDIYKQNYDLMQIVAFIEYLTGYQNKKDPKLLSPDLLKAIANKLLMDRNYKPHMKEQIIAAYQNRVPVRKICKYFRLSNTDFYDMINAHEKDPIALIPKFPEYAQEIKLFLDVLEDFKSNVGGI